ncbi:hypothetical protein ABZ646_17645 [Streptomyces sp. NPDC007162]|uniref:hypothetical protein n=1 Tax=Streptomyces sp. NPDC007162 TaxID=3156917 RepID=UPI003410A7AA
MHVFADRCSRHRLTASDRSQLAAHPAGARALVVAADIHSRTLDIGGRRTAALFNDGAARFVRHPSGRPGQRRRGPGPHRGGRRGQPRAGVADHPRGGRGISSG